jgi:hypothetical protein
MWLCQINMRVQIFFSRFFLFLSDSHKVLIILILLTFVLVFVEIDTNNNSHLQNVIAHGFSNAFFAHS